MFRESPFSTNSIPSAYGCLGRSFERLEYLFGSTIMSDPVQIAIPSAYGRLGRLIGRPEHLFGSARESPFSTNSDLFSVWLFG